jgi:hypothetical protein
MKGMPLRIIYLILYVASVLKFLTKIVVNAYYSNLIILYVLLVLAVLIFGGGVDI